MNEPRPLDEDEFAQRLEKVEKAAQENGVVDPELAAIEDVAQKAKFVAAGQVIGLIHRVRKAQGDSCDQVDKRVASEVGLETPLQFETEAETAFEGLGGAFAEGDSAVPTRIGRFQIRRLLGQGGNGMVFLALDPDLDREVALKVPRPEAFLTATTRERFLREGIAAGGLNHANIVPVFEAGYFGPVCFIASAYCDGPSLGEWVLGQEQAVSPRIAADWLIALADAVQHAHSRGVIHRDLKPDNVLVEFQSDPDNAIQGSPPNDQLLLRISDFGLAKMDDQSDLTKSGSVVGTPNFIAPEQTDSGIGSGSFTVDTYGLGAILYFILCRVPPVTGNSLLETIQKVQEQPPVPPRKLRPDMPRDLEAICLKCLEKNPARRYQTASELQSDLLRFRNGMPVLARRPSTMDKVMMWCRRRPAVSALVASLCLVLAVSSVGLSILLARSNSLKRLSDENSLLATKSASEAAAERDRTREALQAMTSGFASDWLGTQGELTSEQKAFLENTVSYYQKFAAGKTDSPEDLFWVAQAEHRLAQLFSRLGDFESSISSSDRAIGLLEQIPKDWEPSRVAFELADTLHGKDGSLLGRIGEAIPVATRAVEIARELVAGDPEDIQARVLLSKTTGNLGSRFQQSRQLDEALAAKTESVMLLEQLLLDQPGNRNVKRSLGINSMNLGNLFARMSPPRLNDSLAWLERSLTVRTEMVDEAPDSAILQFDLSYVLVNLAGLAHRMNDIERAETLTERATEIARKLVAEHPIEERYRRHLCASLNNLSAIYNSTRKFEKSGRALNEVIALTERSIRDYPGVPMYRLQLANGKSKLATALTEQGQYQDAVFHHDAAVAQLRVVIEEGIQVDTATRMLKSALYSRATALGYLDRHDDAIADWDALIQISRKDEVKTFQLCRSTSLVKKGDVDSALADVERILGEAKELPGDPSHSIVFYNSACVYSLVSAQVEDEDESREHALRAIDLLGQAIGTGSPPPLENVRADPELQPLHAYPEYQALIRE